MMAGTTTLSKPGQRGSASGAASIGTICKAFARALFTYVSISLPLSIRGQLATHEQIARRVASQQVALG